MINIVDRLEDFKATFLHRRKLEKIQEKALVNPDNLLFQVRIGDFLTKLRKKTEAIAAYEQAGQKFIQKNLFAHAIALKKAVFRMKPMRDNGEQTLVLARLEEQMLEYREKTVEGGQESSPQVAVGSSN